MSFWQEKADLHSHLHSCQLADALIQTNSYILVSVYVKQRTVGSSG